MVGSGGGGGGRGVTSTITLFSTPPSVPSQVRVYVELITGLTTSSPVRVFSPLQEPLASQLRAFSEAQESVALSPSFMVKGLPLNSRIAGLGSGVGDLQIFGTGIRGYF